MPLALVSDIHGNDIALAGYNLLTEWQTRSEMVRLADMANGMAGISRLVHELQRERGMSVLFLSSKGAQMRAELADQRKRSDAERRVLGPVHRGHDDVPDAHHHVQPAAQPRPQPSGSLHHAASRDEPPLSL